MPDPIGQYVQNAKGQYYLPDAWYQQNQWRKSGGGWIPKTGDPSLYTPIVPGSANTLYSLQQLQQPSVPLGGIQEPTKEESLRRIGVDPNDPSLNVTRGFGDPSYLNPTHQSKPASGATGSFSVTDYVPGYTGPKWNPNPSQMTQLGNPQSPQRADGFYNPLTSYSKSPSSLKYGPFQSQLPNQGQFAAPNTPQNPFQIPNTQQNPFQSPQQSPFGVNQYYPLSNYYNASPSGGTGQFQQY